MTLAFDVLYPWEYLRKFWNEKVRNSNKVYYYKSFVNIWHVDPESDGTDDSCRWFRPRLNEDDKKIVERISNSYSLRLLWNNIPRTVDIGPTEFELKCLREENKEYSSPTSLKVKPMPYPMYMSGSYTYEFIYNVFLNNVTGQS
jgi:hypothetical protein